MMHAGLLKHRVPVLSPATQTGHVASLRPSWTPVMTIWARVDFPASKTFGGVSMASGSPVAETSAEFTVRYRTDIVPGMALRHLGRDFVVVSADPVDGARQWLSIKTREVKDIACQT